MTNTKSTNPTVDQSLTTVRALLEGARKRLDMETAEVANLEAQVAAVRARGTREVAQLPQRVRDLLTAESLDAAGAAAKLGVPVGRIKPIMDKMREAGQLHNVGSDVEPRWQAVLGDDCTPEVLRETIFRLISWRPWTHKELVVITGARENRVSGELANLREDQRIINLGNGAKARWLVLPADVRVARLPKPAARR